MITPVPAHANLLALSADDHAQYALLTGRSGQTLNSDRLGLGVAPDAASLLIVKNGAALESATLGAELLDETGWTLGAGWSGNLAGGFAYAGGLGLLSRTMLSTGTKLYQITFTVTSASADVNARADITVQIGNSVAFAIYKGGSSPTTYTAGIKSVSDGDLVFTPGATFPSDATLTGVSVKQITATFAPTIQFVDSSGAVYCEMHATPASLYNLYFGLNAGRYNTTGFGNMGFGPSALAANTTGFWNTGVGYIALQANTVGARNTAIGFNALVHNICGHRNAAIGTFALAANTTGQGNIALGSDTLYLNTSGDFNVGIGLSALAANIIGGYNVAIGYGPGGSSVGSNNIFIGNRAGRYETGDNSLYIDAIARATPKSQSIIYGLMNADPTLNALTINGQLGINSQTWQTTPAIPVSIYGSLTGQFHGLCIRNAHSATADQALMVFNVSSSLTVVRGVTIGAERMADSSGEFVVKTALGSGAQTEHLRVSGIGYTGIRTAAPNSPLHVQGSIATAVLNKTADYTLLAADSTCFCTSTGGAFQITLPTAVGCSGRMYRIKVKVGTNLVTVGCTGAETIDGAATYTGLTTALKYVTVQSDGANWWIIGSG